MVINKNDLDNLDEELAKKKKDLDALLDESRDISAILKDLNADQLEMSRHPTY